MKKQIEELKKQVLELKAEIEKLKLQSLQQNHYHYHYPPNPINPIYPTYIQPWWITCQNQGIGSGQYQLGGQSNSYNNLPVANALQVIN